MFKRKSWSLYKGCVSNFLFLCWRSVLWASWTTTDSLVQGMACQLISISKHGFTKLSWLILICCRDGCKSKRTRYSKDYYRHLIWLKRLLAHLFMKLVNMVQKKLVWPNKSVASPKVYPKYEQPAKVGLFWVIFWWEVVLSILWLYRHSAEIIASWESRTLHQTEVHLVQW